MFILELCDNAEILSLFRIVKIAITIIKIVVPIILIISLMLTFLGAIKLGEEDLLKKAINSAVIKCITIVLIFLVPTFINLIINIVGVDSGFADCINNANTETIEQSYISRADKLIQEAEDTKSYDIYYAAVSSAYKIKDEEKRKDYQERLDAVKKVIDENLDAIGSGISNTTGSGDFKVEYDATTDTFYTPGKRATSNADVPRGPSEYGLNPEFYRRLKKLLDDASAKGYKITVSSGYRSYEYQYCLWNCLSNASHRCNQTWVACPGGSNHQYGVAADLSYKDNDAAKDWAHNNASKYKLKFPLGNEDWHIEPTNVVRRGTGLGKCTTPCTNGTYRGKSCSSVSCPAL